QVNAAALAKDGDGYTHVTDDRLENAAFSQTQHLVIKVITAITQHFTQQTLRTIWWQAINDVYHARLHRRIPALPGLSLPGTAASFWRRPATSSGTCSSANRCPSTARNTQI